MIVFSDACFNFTVVCTNFVDTYFCLHGPLQLDCKDNSIILYLFFAFSFFSLFLSTEVLLRDHLYSLHIIGPGDSITLPVLIFFIPGFISLNCVINYGTCMQN